MAQNNENTTESVSSNLGDVEADQQNSDTGSTSKKTNQGSGDSNKNESSDAIDAVNAAESQNTTATAYRDTQRVSPRANEATDRLDTGSGGLSAGGEKSASGF